MAKKDKAKEKVEKDLKAKKAKNLCLYCGREMDEEMMEDLPVETKMPIPRGQWLLITQEEGRADDAQADAERYNQKLSKRIQKMGEGHGLVYMIGLSVSLEKGDHMWEFFYTDPITQKPVYLDKTLNKDQQAEITKLRWDAAKLNQAISDAALSLKEVKNQVAKDCLWGFRPLVTSKGFFIATDLIDEAYKRGKKAAEDKAEKEKEKRRR